MIRRFITSIAIILLAVTAFAATPSGTLPVLYINTNSNAPILNKTDYVNAKYWLDPKGDESINAIGSESAPLDLQIRGRGNYTWQSFDKKPYRLKLGKKQSLMGMAKSKHWALLAHADDNRAFLRNTVGFQLSRLARLPWTPGDKPLEVVLNGDYIGLYFLTETVRVDKDRVDVWDYDSAYEDYMEAHQGETLPWQDIYNTGGWLIEFDNTVDDDQITFESVDPYVPDKRTRIKYESPSDFITSSQIDWLRGELTAIDRLIAKGDKEAMLWAEKIDLTNLARFFVVNQIVFNYESFHGSCKLSRQQGYDTKWNYGPVWDFGSAFQTYEPRFIFDYGPYSNHWIKGMYQYPGFVEEVKRVYATLMSTEYSTLDAYIDSFISKIRKAAACDKQRWPQYGNDNLDSRAAEVKEMLRKSVAYLDHEWLGQGDVEITPPLSDIYLRGEINNWEARSAYKFTRGDNDLFTLHLGHLDGSFKLAGPTWSEGNVDFGGATNIRPDEPVALTYSGSNCTLAHPIDNATLTFDWATKQLTVTASQQSQLPAVYFIDNKDNVWQQAYVFTWSPECNGNWPGSKMTKCDPAEIGRPAETIVWKYVFSEGKIPAEGISGIIFGDGGSKGDHQTADLIYQAGGVYDFNGLVSDVEAIGKDADLQPVYYNLQGIRVDNPCRGIYIVKEGSKVTRRILR